MGWAKSRLSSVLIHVSGWHGRLALSVLAIGLLVLAGGHIQGLWGFFDKAAPANAQTAADVEMFDFGYTPSSLQSTAGQALTLNIDNVGAAPHTFTIDGVVDSGSIAAGASGSVTFTPSQAGTFTFYCTIHGAASMSGQLTVTAAQTPAQPTAPAPQGATATPPPAQQGATATPAPGTTMQPPRTGDGGLLGR